MKLKDKIKYEIKTTIEWATLAVVLFYHEWLVPKLKDFKININRENKP